MGTSWKQAGKQQNASKRGAMVSKLAKEVTVAAKVGDANPANNPRLRAAVEAAKKQSVPKDVIERAIKKGAGLLEPVNYELVTYEGFAPHQVPIIVECLTDNRNRTAADVRVLFRKGTLGAAGTVSYQFDRMGIIEASHSDKSMDIETVAIEVGAQNFETTEDGARFLCDTTDLDSVNKALTDTGWAISASEMGYIAKNPMELGEAEKQEVNAFLEAIDDHDDVHRVYAALK